MSIAGSMNFRMMIDARDQPERARRIRAAARPRRRRQQRERRATPESIFADDPHRCNGSPARRSGCRSARSGRPPSAEASMTSRRFRATSPSRDRVLAPSEPEVPGTCSAPQWPGPRCTDHGSRGTNGRAPYTALDSPSFSPKPAHVLVRPEHQHAADVARANTSTIPVSTAPDPPRHGEPNRPVVMAPDIDAQCVAARLSGPRQPRST